MKRAGLIRGSLIGVAALLCGCGNGVLGMSKLSDVKPVAFMRGLAGGNDDTASNTYDQQPNLAHANQDASSDIIDGLLARRSVLSPASPYAPVAKTMLTTSSGLAQAELRASKMRSVARSKNWLPTIGPSITLSSLGELAAGLIVEQVLYDNGKRKAERAFAAADVEVSAVALSQDMNDRLHTGLTLYITAAEAHEKAGMAARGLGRMQEFNRIVSVRVSGGLSSLSDQRVVQAKLTDMDQEASTHREAERAALSEFNVMTGGHAATPLTQAYAIPVPPAQLAPLEVLRAQAEAKRSVAESKAARAGLLPSLSVGGILGQKNSASADIGGTANLGLGTSADIEALKAQERAAAARVALAKETAARKSARLQNELTALLRQERDAVNLVQQTRTNFRLFQEQFEGGQKTVMDVVGVYEQMVRSELKHIDLKYEITLTQLEMARNAGALADGADI
ncbi:TolC family protein [Pacificibacter marinus]|uniref:Outer membrane efflux protein n=1 Tax=Pacificibacter marinus TaxID=658057 RepID=A0A1Y5TPR1_9RHOB|nr:TolC family protein [Pacificibacter marinus]SEL35102.1 outer membrane protein, adhesin transport system [Pacificibacter marinus]SLN69045.1 Outer membrane efflux protein [Pacificibacter marinus]